jgi:hypothetical protein
VRQIRWPLALGAPISETLTNADVRTASGNTATPLDRMRSTPARALHTSQLIVERFAVHKIDKLDYIRHNPEVTGSNPVPATTKP